MARTIAESTRLLKTALDGDKTALTAKKVSVPDGAKHSDIPGLIAQIKAGGSAKITVTCSEDYEGATLTFTNGQSVITGQVEGGVCEVTPDIEGTWTVTNTVDEQELTCNVVFNKYNLDLKAKPKSVQLCDAETFANTWGGLITPDFNWEYEFRENKGSMIFTDQKAPGGAATHDVSAEKNNSIVTWFDKTNYIVYVSTQNEGVKIKLPSILTDMFLYEYTYSDGEDVDTQVFFDSINLTNVDFSEVTSASYAFCTHQSYYGYYENIGKNIVCNDDWTVNSNIKNSKNVFPKGNDYTDSTVDGSYCKPSTMGGYFTPKS